MALFQPDHAVVIPLIRLCVRLMKSRVSCHAPVTRCSLAPQYQAVRSLCCRCTYIRPPRTPCRLRFFKVIFLKESFNPCSIETEQRRVALINNFLISFIHLFLLIVKSVLSYRCIYINAIMPAAHLLYTMFTPHIWHWSFTIPS